MAIQAPRRGLIYRRFFPIEKYGLGGEERAIDFGLSSAFPVQRPLFATDIYYISPSRRRKVVLLAMCRSLTTAAKFLFYQTTGQGIDKLMSRGKSGINLGRKIKGLDLDYEW